jgi:hypothetical protein
MKIGGGFFYGLGIFMLLLREYYFRCNLGQKQGNHNSASGFEKPGDTPNLLKNDFYYFFLKELLIL